MKRYRGIKYSFRPKSYWDEDNVLQALLRDVKGAERRKMIKAYYDGRETSRSWKSRSPRPVFRTRNDIV